MNVTLHTLAQMKEKQEKITMLTCYDAAFARFLDQVGIDILLVGDTLGEVVQGNTSTLPVTVEHMCYHISMVAKGTQRAFVIGDLPFMSYASAPSALKNAAKIMQAGAQMVKIEGGEWLTETVFQLTERGIPVCGHLGLMPQSVHKMGGYRRQGKTPEAADRLIQEALMLQEAGANLLVMECIPFELAAEVTQQLTIPTIGIGAGPETDGQVLVLYDVLGLTTWKPPGFVQEFFDVCPEQGIEARIKGYLNAVKEKKYPK